MNTILITSFAISIVVSIFFSAAETAFVSVNRTQITQRKNENQFIATLADTLLKNPDALLSFILLGNNLANVAMTTIGALLVIHSFGEGYVFFASVLLTFFILIFCEITPKTLAYRYPLRIVLLSAPFLYPLQTLFIPIVFFLEVTVKLVRRILFIKNTNIQSEVSLHDVRGAVVAATPLLPRRQRDILLNILDLNSMSVGEAMAPLSQIESVDLNGELLEIKNKFKNTKQRRLLAYTDNINSCLGFLNVEKCRLLIKNTNTKKAHFNQAVETAPFIPTTVSLLNQLDSFSKTEDTKALVVDEYGVLQGVLTLNDLVSHITGWIETHSLKRNKEGDGWTVTDDISLRALNNKLNLNLKSESATTLRGLIHEKLEGLPEKPTCVRVGNYRLEIHDIADSEQGASEKETYTVFGNRNVRSVTIRKIADKK